MSDELEAILLMADEIARLSNLLAQSLRSVHLNEELPTEKQRAAFAASLRVTRLRNEINALGQLLDPLREGETHG